MDHSVIARTALALPHISAAQQWPSLGVAEKTSALKLAKAAMEAVYREDRALFSRTLAHAYEAVCAAIK